MRHNYEKILEAADSYLEMKDGNSGIHEIGKKMECYFYIVLKDAYKGTQIK